MIVLEPIGQLAAVVWRREHYHTSQIFNLVFRQILTENDSAQGVRNKMNFNRSIGRSLLKQTSQPIIGGILDRKASRGVRHADHPVALPSKSPLQPFHGPSRAAQAKDQHD